jgi:hypothetical protein
MCGGYGGQRQRSLLGTDSSLGRAHGTSDGASVLKPCVKSNKNEANDAEAIAEAVMRPNMRFVSLKSVEQQDMQ